MPVYVVTGARGGIGLEYVRQLTTNPSNTVIATLRDTSADISDLQDCDISSESSIATLAQAIPPIGEEKIDVLINNAAIQQSQDQTGLKIDGDSLLSHMKTNVLGPAKITQTLLPYLRVGSAVIANISSGLGSLAVLSDRSIDPCMTSYSISKCALNMLMVHQAYELKGVAVVVCVDPGHVKTVMGGPEVAVEVDDSARGVLKVLSGLKTEDTGKFFQYTGDNVPF
ncbi:NAD(P)-binding protein [Apiospora saccharicola]|uniref:NAD(P)-binding protein n=1 Tax=Apiospora saccharicola TaxID=335842 RepID=A0ABR1VM21_9PEZI